MATHKYVYFFGDGSAEGGGKMKNELGGKGANLAEMTNIGLPVPAGFTLNTDVCTYFYDHERQYPPELSQQVEDALHRVEQVMGAKFGDAENPLLLSCRSGARESMPGMMDTVLNIGLNETTVQALIKQSGNEHFAWDSYRRLIQMYGDVVLGLKPENKNDPDHFEDILDTAREKAGVEHEKDLSIDNLKQIVADFKAVIKKHAGVEFPTDPMDQLWGCIGAVFGSWMNDRAIVYRRQYGIPHSWGTAVNVQAMVFGNLGDDCATGVGLTRNCSDGTPGFCGDYLINAQGEDVVAGTRTPKRVEVTLADDMPEAYEQLNNIGKTLEQHYKDVQDIEFTVQKGRVWMLQTRNAKRTGFAAVRIAVDLVNENLIDPKTALEKRRIPADDLNQLLQPIFDPDAKAAAEKENRLLAKGINAGPGAATGQIVFHASDAEERWNADNDLQLVLVRKETSPEDLRGMKVAKGILTAFGGASSHAALVSRQMGKTCVCGCKELNINYEAGTVTVDDTVLKDGDWISIDGFSGEVFAGKIETSPSEVMDVLMGKREPEDSETYGRYAQLMQWADDHRRLKVRANAEAHDAEAAVALGAEGVGLCRTEHMFFDHLDEIREMIFATKQDDRAAALAKLLPFQRDDFTHLFRTMGERPVTIRLLDPPLHEFLSVHHLEEEPGLAEKLATQFNVSLDDVKRRVEELAEVNPMLGHRGCRLGIVYPEITAMQARAIMEAACAVRKEGIEVKPEIMIPLAGYKTEFQNQAAIVRQSADAVIEEQGVGIHYTVGTMIEIPRAALTADEIAEEAEFFSFGTNDLTQTTLGMSRDDYKGFIGYYMEHDIVPGDPFQSIDQTGVGTLMKIGVEKGRATRKDLKIGICGEHGGDPKSVYFCDEAELDYVSCSPRRIPIARLAAAQSAVASRDS
ncbi:MAG: pyruvate, phosphate dikinase [Planctomycetota bacterium]|nr:MAG: pyruvate, phosphate dikinase [Planctomycetota bacterium]REK24198.1 MAG: pyruvate, phosphate dikinase [Planctomycetota bacterium]REK28814.1 MAG: pyruvate, phosphate dikinase [Planctomycetota bacterium]